MKPVAAVAAALLASLSLAGTALANEHVATRLQADDTMLAGLLEAYQKAGGEATEGPLVGRECLPRAGCKRYKVLYARYYRDEYAVAALWSARRGFTEQPSFFKRHYDGRGRPGEWAWVGETRYGKRSWAGLPCPVLKVWRLSCELATATHPLDAVRR